MRRDKVSHNRGQSLIEILLAMSVSVVVVGTIAILLLSTQISVQRSLEHAEATGLAQEGLAALSAIAQHSFDDIASGTHGVALVNNVWQLSSSSDVSGKFTREITLTQREAGLFEATSTVHWQAASRGTSTVSYTSYIANWEQTADTAQYLSFETDYAYYTASGTSLLGITVSNTHPSNDITMTVLTLTWNGAATLDTASIAGAAVYTASSSGAVASGAVIDIADTTITAGSSTVAFGPFVFTDDLLDSDMHIVVTVSDGSKHYTRAVL